MKQFDDIFRENVEKAFSNYNADHLADEGWNSFVAGKKGQPRRAALIPFWARAASVMLIIGLSVFIAYRISTRQTAQEIITATEFAGKKDEDPVVPNEAAKPVIPVIASSEKPESKEGQIDNKAAENRQAYSGGDSLLELIPLKKERILLPGIAETRFLKPGLLPDFPEAGVVQELHEKIITEDVAPESMRSAAVMSEGFNNVEKASDKEKSSGRSTLMAGFSGLMAQTGETSSPATGISVGFYFDQKITKKISVRPGLALAMQSFGLENGNNSAGINYSFESLYDGTSAIPYSYNGHLSMLAMELPLNLVFRIIDKERSGFYVSAGASTMFYLSQQFTADFVNEYTKVSYDNMTSQYSSETRYSTVEVEKEYGAFSHADFFGLANLSAGYSFPYSKTGTMLIEPFLQLPLSDLTSLNLRVRYGGVSMKLRFGKQEREK